MPPARSPTADSNRKCLSYRTLPHWWPSSPLTHLQAFVLWLSCSQGIFSHSLMCSCFNYWKKFRARFPVAYFPQCYRREGKRRYSVPSQCQVGRNATCIRGLQAMTRMTLALIIVKDLALPSSPVGQFRQNS